MDHFDFDLYEELGIKPSATEVDVRSAYKKKALVHHPDRNGGKESEEFLRLKQAYDVLVDPAKRQNYDAYHDSGEFRRDGRPLSAKEAAWLVDQQKRSWGVKEIHPFAVCILCDSCPCPADGVCSGCGMTYCQLCVRKMHCRGGMTPHYPLKTSTAFSEKLKKEGIEKERENRLLKGNSNQWLMHDEDFRHQRDVYKARAKAHDPSLVYYWAWGQTRYTVHLAMWLASESNDAEIEFSVTEEGKQRIRVTPHGAPQLLDRVFAYEVNTSRAGEAFNFDSMHCMTFVMLKAQPGQRWRSLFEGDSEGVRELPLHSPPHTVEEQQVDGFKPVNHYRVAGRKDTASEWYEISINVPIPEATERRHVEVSMDGTRLSLKVAGWMHWERRLNQRVIRWEDKHESRTHVDLHNSTWLMTRDEAHDFKCVQFVLSEWQEGANKNQEGEVRKQLEADKGKVLLEDADPFHMYDLVEAEMFLRAGAVFKPRAKLRTKALELVEQMEKQTEAHGGSKEELHEAPFADVWQDDLESTGMHEERQIVVRDEQGGEVEEASEWWQACEQQEKDEWCEEVLEQAAEVEARRAYARQMAKDQEERSELAAKERAEEEERQRNLRRKEQALKNREEALKLAAKLGATGADVSAAIANGGAEVLQKQMGIEQAREAAAAAARANPLAPKRVEVGGLGLTVGSANANEALPLAPPSAPTTASLAKCGYWFEDANDEIVKVTVPLEKALEGRGGELLKEEGVVHATFADLSFRLEVRVGAVTHVLTSNELLHRIDPKLSSAKPRVKTKRVVLELAKYKRGQAWKSLS